MSVKVQGSGPLDARILFVGEAPGEEETRQGRPFVGNAGTALRKWMMEVGLDPESVRFENLCKYRPPGNKLAAWVPRGKANQLVIEGLIELMQTIESMPNLNVIVGLGSFPLHYLTGKGKWNYEFNSYTGIDFWRGNILPSVLVEGKKVICSYHPSYLIQEGMADHGTFLVDLTRIKEDSEFPELHHPVREHICAPVGHDRLLAKERLLDCPKDATLTLDIEYIRSKKTGKARLICVGLTNSREWAVCFATDSQGDLDFIRSIIDEGHPLNMQNSMFDASIMEYHYGINLQKYLRFDSMLAAYAANIELPKSLDYLMSLYTRQPNHKGMVDWNAIAQGRQDINIVYDYNCIDVWGQHEVMEEQIKYDLNDARVKDVFEFGMALLDPLWEVSKRGMRLDHGLMQEVSQIADKEVLTLGHLLNSIVGRQVNVKSGPDVMWILQDVLKLELTRKTKKGAFKTDDKTLAAYLVKCKDAKQEAVLNLIRDIRNRRDLKSKFYNVKLDDDGRSRGHYDPTKTVTGRLSSKKFYPTDRGHQQQNIPGDKRVKRCFIPDEGKKFGYADLERAESLVVAHITNDPLMLAHHAPGTDAHRALASKLFGIPEEAVTKDQRYLGKQTRHAGNYMEGPETMKMAVNQKAHLTGVSVSYGDCDKFISAYRTMHQFLVPWWKSVEIQLWKDRTLYNLLGRRRIFFDHIKGTVPKAVAYVPQSTVGDCLNCGVLAVHGKVVDYMRPHLIYPEKEIKEMAQALIHDWGFEMLNQVHDAIGFQFLPEHEYNVASTLRKLMSFTLQNPKTYEDFSIAVEVLTGPNWGDVEVYKGDLHAA